ncbi:LIM and calponin homology domains-containing protein 1a isoform X10 [Latimeria chalumnae]|uniref:LIM and calponin homology domains-containing protein 1a isoform X10 n=1 Tax=Latimeria chalumnae TaxID=7897 RepID=UPI0006D93453|nr:PREDICTED: LIM and calponin homology domains-containing protein 1 isoform X9 [Latimeria chalumnae]|eukprot:XP_014346237.1 PREDICTED: LIM and calponin homology domains-containing protein 1 isoform X9 [Latimeria chalumnae]
MASPGLQLEENHHQQDSVLELAFNEAQKWIEQVTGRSFGDKDFRSGLENGILLCELLNAIKPGLVKKINRLPTPIAGLDNISLFLRGCKELGLKESQLFDPSDLQDTSHRLGVRSPDCSRKLKNVLITIYWLGKVANSCASYNGATLNLKEFEGLLAQIKKETEEVDSPKRSIRDSGYIDCWDSERSDSLSPPRHGRDDSFDSLDSFGSRSQQTPSPDVILKGSSDGRGSDSESDMPHRKMLDSRKDDMSARRTSYSEPKTAVPFNQYLPNKSNQTCYMPASLRKKKAEREEYRKSWSTATSPLGGERPFSQNPPETIEEEQYEATLQYEEEGAKHKISKIETSEQVVKFKLDSDLPKGDLRDQSPSDRSNKTLTQKWEGKDEEEIRKLQRLEQAGIKVMPASKRYSRYGPRTSLSDDAESVSMFDMRCEDEALVQPHSKTRYERIQDVNNQLKEEEERWQDDLARWKTRRRSASQDLIKKEEERKMMEKLMCGEDGLTGRRKSIKTYREIVEEKERRERELHEAYKNARSREEADRILHRYVQRFAISEAVLERLEMPKFFERSQSVESDGSSSSPSKDSNPLKYLRQQSLPAQKFTATVETTIVSSSQPQANSPTNRTSPSKTIVSKAVPVLTPKPYSQPKSSQQSFKSFKVDGKLNVNGETSETFNGVEEKERFPAKVDPSLTRSQMFEGVASVDESRVTEQQSSMCRDTKPAGPGSPCGNKQQPESGIEKPAVSKKPVQEECDSGAELDATKKQTLKAPQDGKHLMDARNLHSSTVVTRLEFAPSKSPKEASPEHKAPADTGNIQDSSSVELVTHEAQKSKTPEQEVESLFEFLKKAPETNQGASQISPVSGEPAELHSGEVQTISVPPLNLPKRLDHWSWNPEEERKRQERWQKEQERLLQERYQREQEKLKEEWERAQKEVEEEERRYHEEERKIIEETVATFTPHSTLSSPSPTDHPSPLTPEESRNSESAALLLGGWENKQEPQKKPLQLAEAETWQIIERQKKDDQQQLPGELERETVLKKEENEHCTEKWSSKTPSYKEPLAQKQNQQDCQIPMLENSSHVKTEFQFTQDMSWNQQSLIKPPQVSQDVRKKTASLDRSWGQQPFVTEGMRRSGSHENLGTAPPYSSALQGQSPNRSVSGKKLCSTCGHPLGKGAAMIIETLSLYFHIQCFKCGICKGQLGDATTGTDVRIRNGLLNCNDCYIRSRTAGQPTTL